MIASFIASLFGSLWAKLVAAFLLVGGGIGAIAKMRNDAVKIDRAKRKEEDHEKASGIRTRVRSRRIERMHDLKDRGYRD